MAAMAAPKEAHSSSNADVIELTKELRDPFVVFYEEDVLTPVPDAQPVSSLEEFAEKYLRCQKTIEETEVAALTPALPPLVAQQEAPVGGGRQRRTLPSVVERSTAGGLHSTGPLSILFRAVRDRLRVKVWTRSHTRMRSILTAFVQAYDRHINLALADVDEVLLLPASDRPPPPPLTEWESLLVSCDLNEQLNLIEAVKKAARDSGVLDYGFSPAL